MNGTGKNKMRRTGFTIHSDHSVEVSTSKGSGRLGTGLIRFSTVSELKARVALWPGERLVKVWNKLPNVTPVVKFTDRSTALRRIWAKIQEQVKLSAPSSLTKAERIVTLLKQPEGASLRAIMDLTG
jgi:hypothetical protein